MPSPFTEKNSAVIMTDWITYFLKIEANKFEKFKCFNEGLLS